MFVDLNHAKVKPERIELIAGAGFQVVLKDMKHWRDWGTEKRARVRGRYRYETCDPDCATGGYDTTGAKVRLSKLRRACGEDAVYRKIEINPRKEGFRTFDLRVNCDGYGAARPKARLRDTPGHGWDARCGSQSGIGFGWYNVRAFNVTCRKARSVAREYTFGGFERRVQGFRCRSEQTGLEVSRTDCKRRARGRHKHIRFDWGA